MNRVSRAVDRIDVRFSATRVGLVRVLLFGVLAVDAFLMLRHAPRYGAGGFNVSHFPFLDAWLPLPDRRVLVVVLLAESYLAARIALGVGSEYSVRLLAVLWGITVFWSQLDSYQHHYLVVLILVLAGFVPWGRARRLATEAADGESPEISSPALRLVPTQLAIVYFWAAVAKLDPRWLDGTALRALWTEESLLPLVRALGAATGSGDGFAALAWIALLAEVVLVVALLVRPLWPLAIAVGVPLHVGIEIAQLEIGRFTFLLLALYSLLLPAELGRGLVSRGRAVFRRLVPRRARPVLPSFGPRPLHVGVALALGSVAVARLPFEASGAAALLVAALGLAAALLPSSQRPQHGLGLPGAHLLACLALVGLHLVTDQAFSYWNYLGGASRRLGDPATAELAYERLTELEPGYGPAWTHLGNLADREGDVDRALELYARARELEPPDPRPFRAGALLLLQRGDETGALQWLRDCRRRLADPSDCEIEKGSRREPGRHRGAVGATSSTDSRNARRTRSLQGLDPERRTREGEIDDLFRQTARGRRVPCNARASELRAGTPQPTSAPRQMVSNALRFLLPASGRVAALRRSRALRIL